MWCAQFRNVVVIVSLLAGCVETIDVSMRVVDPMCDGNGGNGNRTARMSRYKVTFYRPDRDGRCCVDAGQPVPVNACTSIDVIAEQCVASGGGGVAPSASKLNSELAVAGIALPFDPDRPTCVRVAALDDPTIDLTGATPVSVSCDTWPVATPMTARICGHTSTPATGTGLIEVDATRCASANVDAGVTQFVTDCINTPRAD